MSFEVAAGVASLSALLGVWIAWHLFREYRELARLKNEADLHELYSAFQTLVAPLDNLQGLDWIASRLTSREADVVFWEVAQQPPEHRSHVLEHLHMLTDVTTLAQVEHVLQQIRNSSRLFHG